MLKISFFITVLVAVVYSNTFAYAKVVSQDDGADQGLSEYDTINDEPEYPEGLEEYSEEKAYTDGPLPELLSESQNLTKRLGETVYLPCETKHAEDFSLMWYKDRILLYQDKFEVTVIPNIRRMPNQTLEIKNISENDVGKYICTVAAEKTLTVIYYVTVQTMPRIIKMIPDKSTIVDLDETLSLSCKVAGEPMPTVTWSKDGHNLYKSENREPTHVYTIDHIKKSNAGVYQCLAHSPGFTSAHDSITVQVQYAPIIKPNKTIVTTAENYNAELVCIVDAFPKPIVEWFKDGKRILDNKRIKTSAAKNHHILEIKKVEKSDFGKYSCTAGNHKGKLTADIVLTGVPGVAVLRNISNDENNLILTWHVESISPISAYHLQYKNRKESDWKNITNIEVMNPEGMLYIVNHTLANLEEVQYVARLKAKNSYGWSEYSPMAEFNSPIPANISGSYVPLPSVLVFICFFITLFRFN